MAAFVANTSVSELERCRSGPCYAPTPGIAESVVTKHLLSELGPQGVTQAMHVDRQAAKGWSQSRRGLGLTKHILRKNICVQVFVEKKRTDLTSSTRSQTSRSDGQVALDTTRTCEVVSRWV